MGTMEYEVYRAMVRGMRREFEREFLAGIRTIRLELELLATQDRVAELEASEWARLEPVPSERRGA